MPEATFYPYGTYGFVQQVKHVGLQILFRLHEQLLRLFLGNGYLGQQVLQFMLTFQQDILRKFFLSLQELCKLPLEFFLTPLGFLIIFRLQVCQLLC